MAENMLTRSVGKNTKIVVHGSLSEALQAMEIILLDPWFSGVGTLADLTASSLAQDRNPRSNVFGCHAYWADEIGPPGPLQDGGRQPSS